MSITPVGAFKLDIGPETPTYYLLIPATSVEDAGYVGHAPGRGHGVSQSSGRILGSAGFCSCVCSGWRASLLSAFAGWPKLVAPKSEKRIFQLRTYESTGHAAHVRKVQMFNEAEIGIFVRTGLAPVFFGDTLIGHRMPSLTYMLTFAGCGRIE